MYDLELLGKRAKQASATLLTLGEEQKNIVLKAVNLCALNPRELRVLFNWAIASLAAPVPVSKFFVSVFNCLSEELA